MKPCVPPGTEKPVCVRTTRTNASVKISVTLSSYEWFSMKADKRDCELSRKMKAFVSFLQSSENKLCFQLIQYQSMKSHHVHIVRTKIMGV